MSTISTGYTATRLEHENGTLRHANQGQLRRRIPKAVHPAYARATLAINASVSVNATAYLPSDMKAGSFYVLQVVDDQGKVVESDENDNMFTRPIKVAAAPDLWAKSITLKSAKVKAGDIVEGEIEHVNIGGLSTGKGFVGQFRISKDKFISSTDTLAGISTFNALDAGKSEKAAFKFLLPSAIGKGTWYVGYWVDASQNITEGNESNNYEVIALTVE